MRKNVKVLGKAKIKSDGSIVIEKPKVPKRPGPSGYNLQPGTPTAPQDQ